MFLGGICNDMISRVWIYGVILGRRQHTGGRFADHFVCSVLLLSGFVVKLTLVKAGVIIGAPGCMTLSPC